jgi:hypothetical protein
MKIEFEDNEYEIDVERAIELGICKKARKEITEFRVGDVFENSFDCRLLIVEHMQGGVKYNIAGLNGLILYSDFDEPLTHSEMLEFLNDGEYKFVANINDKIAAMIETV